MSIEPLNPEVRRLLDEAMPREPTIPDALRGMLRSRIDLALVVAPAIATPRPWFGRLRQGLALSAALVAGAVGALMVERALAPPALPAVSIPASVVLAPVASAAPPSPPASQGASTSATPAASVSAPSAPIRTSHRDDSLAAEARLVDTARAALTHGDFAAALAAIDAHVTAFPRGRLSEEREAIAVQALVGAGRIAEARARGDLFHQRYPDSLFSPLVDAALGATR